MHASVFVRASSFALFPKQPSGNRARRAVVLAMAMLAAVSVWADEGNKGDKQENDGKNVDLSRLVIIGDSLSAGFQNLSLYASDTAPVPGGQQYGYASLVAQQAGVPVPVRRISYPGIPPALLLTPGGIIRAAGTGAPLNMGEQAYNLSVPGFTVGDALAHTFPGDSVNNAIDALSDLIVGLPGNLVPGCGPLPAFLPNPPSPLVTSQMICAAALKPTTVLASVGNNDALQSLTVGLPPTDPAVFAAQYGALVGTLSATGANLVVSNIPDVANIPFLVPVPVFVGQCGFLPIGPPNYVVTNADFIVADITNPNATSFSLCMNYAVRSAALIALARTRVIEYNQIIDAVARQSGAVVVDMNGLFADLAKKGYEVGGRRLTAAFLGGLFSLDGIHPTNTGYAIMANEVIKTMNKQLHTGIPPLSVEQIAKADPLVPPKH